MIRLLALVLVLAPGVAFGQSVCADTLRAATEAATSGDQVAALEGLAAYRAASCPVDGGTSPGSQCAQTLTAAHAALAEGSFSKVVEHLASYAIAGCAQRDAQADERCAGLMAAGTEAWQMREPERVLQRFGEFEAEGCMETEFGRRWGAGLYSNRGLAYLELDRPSNAVEQFEAFLDYDLNWTRRAEGLQHYETAWQQLHGRSLLDAYGGLRTRRDLGIGLTFAGLITALAVSTAAGWKRGCIDGVTPENALCFTGYIGSGVVGGAGLVLWITQDRKVRRMQRRLFGMGGSAHRQ